jgi:hypothetical protein
MSLVEETVGDSILEFKQLQTEPFMGHWKNLCIIEYVEDMDDYRFKLWGTDLTRLFESDPTNKMMAMDYPDEKYKNFRDLNADALKESQMICSNDTLDWMNRDHAKWHQVSMPLSRKNKILETLSFVLFE